MDDAAAHRVLQPARSPRRCRHPAGRVAGALRDLCAGLWRRGVHVERSCRRAAACAREPQARQVGVSCVGACVRWRTCWLLCPCWTSSAFIPCTHAHVHTCTHRARREAVTGGRPGSRLDAHEHLKRLRGDEDAAVILEAAHFLSFAYAAFSWPIECYTKGPAAACADMCGAWRSLLLLCKLHPTPKACAHGHPCHSVCVPVRLCACVPVCLCVCVSVCLCPLPVPLDSGTCIDTSCARNVAAAKDCCRLSRISIISQVLFDRLCLWLWLWLLPFSLLRVLTLPLCRGPAI